METEYTIKLTQSQVDWLLDGDYGMVEAVIKDILAQVEGSQGE